MRLFAVVMGMCGLVIALSNAQGQSVSRQSGSSARQAVTGPSEPINRAIAAGATATITLQPVQPKTVPASNYPMGTTIVGSEISLGSVPARVWFELHITGWAPDVLKTFQAKIDARDFDEDGGGYEKPDCGGMVLTDAGHIFPAIQPCTVSSDCRASMSGIAGPCFAEEPSKCVTRPSFFPPGGKVCENGFFDRCDPQYIGSGVVATTAFDYATIDVRWGGTFAAGEVPTDFNPSYAGTLILDVPFDAKGAYGIDFAEQEVFLQNTNPPGQNNIPIAALNMAVVKVTCGSCCTEAGGEPTCTDGVSATECAGQPSESNPLFRPGTTCDQAECCVCQTNSDCNDNNACTTDICVGLCVCQHEPVATWNQATECCNPSNGAQGLIPPAAPCRDSGCSMGGNLGIPTYTHHANGAGCTPFDICYLDGKCLAGQCIAEQYAGTDCPKSRHISFETDSGGPLVAYRVRMVSLHHPSPPYGGPVADFTAFEGDYRWVGPPTQNVESSVNLELVTSAVVGCAPHYQDWMGNLLHVTGDAIVPSSVYEVQSIEEGLDINVESNYSAPITIITSRWCDVVYPYAPPSTSEQPDATDHAALIDKFRSISGAISKPRALLVGDGPGGIPNPSLDVDFGHISAAVDAFKNRPYPFAGPTPCP